MELKEKTANALQRIAHETRPSVGQALTRTYANDLAEAILPIIEEQVKEERDRIVKELAKFDVGAEEILRFVDIKTGGQVA